ncbi:MAG: S9 family peptidase [Candidatus Eremiobacteraeota bacterium]|nr:S9 family peptidase [Candidatus Eremiobacteraeota bacterium]
MRWLCLFLLLSLAAGADEGTLVREGIPPIPEAVAERLRQYSETRSANLCDWDPTSGGVIILTRFGQTNQLHRVAGAGAARTQLTFFDEPVAGAAVRPAGGHGLVFLKDVGGGEFYQLYYLDLDSGQSQLLTDGKARHGSPVWSHAGDRVAFYGTARNGKDWDIYTATPEGDRRLVYQAEGSFMPMAWSPDDRQLLLRRYHSANDSSLYLLELASGKLVQVDAGPGEVAHGPAAAFSGGSVYFTSDRGQEFLGLVRQDSGGALTRFELPWDVTEVEASPQGKVAFVANQGGIDHLYLLDPAGRPTEVEGTPVGTMGNLRFSPDGKKLAFSADAATSPGDVYVYDLAAARLEAWTHSEVGGLDTSRFVAPSLVEFASFDKRKIPAFYYRPRGTGPFATVVLIHGGPESQFTPAFSSTIQYLVNEMGLAVVAPNVRGSRGYGKSYLKLDDGRRREDSVKDIGALLDWIAAQPELDSRRIAVYGGSYGGYMVLASLIHFPDRLAAGIDVVGISNFVTFLENTQDYRRDRRRVEYGDERDPQMRQFLTSISPTTRAAAIRAPLLVVQGFNDPRVPVSESEQMVAEVRGQGGQVWYLMARDEGHGFKKKDNREAYLQSVVLFLETHLK